MNESFMRSLSDKELLRHANPSTELERMLLERLEAPEADPAELEAALEAASEAQDEAEELGGKLEKAEETIEALKDYAKSLHAALALVEPENELLTDDDYEMLK